MLIVVRTPEPCIRLDAKSWPGPAAGYFERLYNSPEHSFWIVPTTRRCRLLREDWLHSRPGLQPAFHTLDSFVAYAQSLDPGQRPPLSDAERWLQLARAWHEASGREPGPGFVEYLDRFVRDWQTCDLPTPTRPEDAYERLVRTYQRWREEEGWLDGPGRLLQTANELDAPRSEVRSRLLASRTLVVFDGFHRLEPLELKFIAALSHQCDVVLWLVGTSGQSSWATLEAAVAFLERRRAEMQVVDHVPAAAGPIAALGRRLFPAEVVAEANREPAPGVHRFEAAGPVEELEAIARRIKADYRAGQAGRRPLRLCEVAVVIPGPPYDALVPEVFARCGLPVAFGERAESVARSRPARILASAWQVIAGQWRRERLIDFLNQPPVKRRLAEPDLLFHLFGHRARARRLMDGPAWVAAWHNELCRVRERVERLRSGQEQVPAYSLLSRDELVKRQVDFCDRLERLVTSAESVLRSVLAMEAALRESQPHGSSLAAFAEACEQLLETLAVYEWLSPSAEEPSSESDAPRQAADVYRNDQFAYSQLLSVLRRVKELPQGRLPRSRQRRPDALRAVQIALAAERYRMSDADPDGVQVLAWPELPGMRFRHVYAVGLNDGVVPRLPEEGPLASRRRKQPDLRGQSDRTECEARHHFAQASEAARERLTLSRPRQQGNQAAAESPYWRAACACAELEELEIPPVVVCPVEAASQVGSIASGTRANQEPSTRLRPSEQSGAQELFQQWRNALMAWQSRPGWPTTTRIVSPALLRPLFADDRPLSASDLETYAACPFRYFGTQVLRLQERETDQTRIHYGSLVHRVLQAFYLEMRKELQCGEHEPLPPVDGRHRARLLEIFEREWQEAGDGTLPPDLRHLFACEDGVLQLFLEAMALLEAAHGNLLNEFDLATPDGKPALLGADAAGRPVYLSGRIDRIDVHREDGLRALVIDYKTGKPVPAREREKKTADGRMLQLPLYAAALSAARPGLQAVAGAYIYLSEHVPDAPRALGAAGLSGTRGADIPFDPDAARQKAIELAGRMRAGDFGLTPHADECSPFCAMRQACRHPGGYPTSRY